LKLLDAKMNDQSDSGTRKTLKKSGNFAANFGIPFRMKCLALILPAPPRGGIRPRWLA
jgi:hypothetical protein